MIQVLLIFKPINNENSPVDNDITKLISFSLVKVARLSIIVSKKNIINNNNENISYHNKAINPKSGHNI